MLIDLVSDSIFYLVISFLVSAAISPIVISLLYKLHFTARHVVNKDKKNKEFIKIHGWKSGTPTMGGIIFFITVPLLSWLILPHTDTLKGFVVGLLIFGLVGIADDLFTMYAKRKNKLREIQNHFLFRVIKLTIMYAISLAFSYIFFVKIGTVGYTNADILGFSVPVFYKYLIAGLVLPVVIYAFDIYDGADGLSSGTLIVNTLGMASLLLLLGRYEFVPALFMLTGGLIVFLYFNIPPARVWMGAPGAMSIAFGLFYIAIVTKTIVPFFIITLVQWIDFSSSVIQIFSLKFLKKKVFKIAPLHHLFEAIGWPEYKVVMRFWLTSLVTTIIGVWVGLAILA
ncbi:MAG: hypothetical protein ABIC57_02185 [bacterium]